MRECGRKKLRKTEEERLRELLLMTAVSIVVWPCVAAGGLTDTVYFRANPLSEGPSQAHSRPHLYRQQSTSLAL